MVRAFDVPDSHDNLSANQRATDAALVRGHLLGVAGQDEELIRRHAAALYRFIYPMLRNPTDAEDMCQQAFARAFAALPSYQESGTFRGWLFRIARNEALGLIRRRQRRPQPARTVKETDPAPNDTHLAAASADTIRGIRMVIAALPENEREVVQLRLREGLTFREIADLLDTPLGTILFRMKTARERLRSQLAPLLDDHLAPYLKP